MQKEEEAEMRRKGPPRPRWLASQCPRLHDRAANLATVKQREHFVFRDHARVA